MGHFVKPPAMKPRSSPLMARDPDSTAAGGSSPLRSSGRECLLIDGTVVNVALPALQSDLHAIIAEVQWVVESYALFLPPSCSRLRDVGSAPH